MSETYHGNRVSDPSHGKNPDSRVAQDLTWVRKTPFTALLTFESVCLAATLPWHMSRFDLKKEAWLTYTWEEAPTQGISGLPTSCPVKLSELIRHQRMSGSWHLRTNTKQRKLSKEGNRRVTFLQVDKVGCLCQFMHFCCVFGFYYRSLELH